MSEMKRFFTCRCADDGPCYGEMYEANQGDWVKFSDLEPLIEALKKIANQDFRGPRPEESVIAYEALKKAGVL